MGFAALNPSYSLLVCTFFSKRQKACLGGDVAMTGAGPPHVGPSLAQWEDRRLLTGQGQFVAAVPVALGPKLD
jgi:hypothetical protein